MIEKPPKINISGVALDCEQISWTMISGVRSNKTQFSVSKTISDQLEKLQNPVYLNIEAAWSMQPDGSGLSGGRTITGPGSHGSLAELVSVTFQNLYLLEIKEAASPWERTWEMGDQRFKWEGIKIQRMYNIHWGSYETASLIKKDARFADFTIIQEKRYATWSLRDRGKNKFALVTDDSKIKATPWTALQIVVDLLQNELGVDFARHGIIDNKYQPENLIYDGDEIQGILEQMMQAAYISLYQAPDGKIHLFNIGDESKMADVIKMFGNIEGSPMPLRQNLKRVRPEILHIYFDQEHEVRFNYISASTPTGSHTVERGTSVPNFTLENVLQLPDTLTVSGKKFTRGTWVTFDDAFTAWNNDSTNPQPTGQTLTTAAIHKYWLGESRLEYRFALDPKSLSGMNPIWTQRVSAIRQHYRQTFRILPYWMKRIRSVSADRAALLDPVTGQRQPSPVYSQYCEIPSFRKLLKSKQKNKYKAALNIDNFFLSTEFARPSPATASIIDEKLGIFRIDYLSDPRFYVSEIVPSLVDSIPGVSVGSSGQDQLWSFAKLKSDFSLGVILSVVFAIPNDLDAKHLLAYDIPDGAKGVKQHVISRRDTARWEWTDRSKAIIEGGKIIVIGSKLANKNVIEAIGQSEAERIRFSWEDRVIGTFSRPGWEPGWVPFAWVKSVTVGFSVNDGINTMFNLSEPPKGRDLITMLPQYVRNILNRGLNQSRGI